MAFPGTYNISYYKGDTLEFRVYPKDSTGDPFNLQNYTTSFTISNARGSDGAANQINAYSIISEDGLYILCAIRPTTDGAQLNAGTTYVYDVEISKTATPYPFVYTVLTGNITVTDQVTGAT